MCYRPCHGANFPYTTEEKVKHGRKDYDERIQDSAGIIPADEPVFLIRGQDQMAARAVRHYADLIESKGASAEDVAAVHRHALAMTNWRPKKIPDVPPKSRNS